MTILVVINLFLIFNNPVWLKVDGWMPSPRLCGGEYSYHPCYFGAGCETVLATVSALLET